MTSMNEDQERQITSLLRGLAAETEPPRLPTPGQIWWKAEVLRRLEERQQAADRAASPARWAQTAGLITGGIGLATMAVLGVGSPLILAAGLPLAVAGFLLAPKI